MDLPGLVRPSRGRRDDGSIVLGWLTRLTVTLTVLGVVGFEVLSVAVAKVSLQDHGQEAAQEAITAYQNTRDPQQAYAAAAAVAEQNGATIRRRSFTVADDGAVSFDISSTATTLLLYRVDRLSSLAEVSTRIYEEPVEQSGIQS